MFDFVENLLSFVILIKIWCANTFQYFSRLKGCTLFGWGEGVKKQETYQQNIGNLSTYIFNFFLRIKRIFIFLWRKKKRHILLCYLLNDQHMTYLAYPPFFQSSISAKPRNITSLSHDFNNNSCSEQYFDSTKILFF